MQLTLFDNYELEVCAEPTFTTGSAEKIKQMMPFLLDTQSEDIAKAENRFQVGKGYLFTNGTGTGKTFVGLGIATRFYNQDKRNILIVVPTDKKCADWKNEAERFFNLEIHQLESTQDKGFEVTVTTYANFYQNQAILNVNWDLVIYDESHYLSQNEQGYTTAYYSQHQIVANLPQQLSENLGNFLCFTGKTTKEPKYSTKLFLQKW